MNRRGFFGLVVFGVAGLTACNAVPIGAEDNAGGVVDHEIQSAVDQIRVSQSRLAQTGALNQRLPPIASAEQNAAGSVSVAWDGDVMPLLKGLAAERQMRFSAIGVRLPLPVSLHVDQVPLESVLQALRAQTAYRASIEVTATSMSLRYANGPL